MSTVIDSVSYDQYKNIPTTDEMGIKTKIIFSQEAYLKMWQLLKNSKDSGNETGCFFVGRQAKNNPGIVYFDFFTSDFKTEDAFVSGGSANPTEQTYMELNQELIKYKQNSERASVMHFHTHPRQLHYENFSDQDLSLYAQMAYDNPSTNTFAMLGFPIPDSQTMGVSVVQVAKPEKVNGIGTAYFFRCPNVYYFIKNEILKIGSFEKRYNGRKYKANSNGSIVKNSVEVSRENKVCGIGNNPNTGERIVDESVGYVDVNRCFCFPEENLNAEFGDSRECEYER